MKILHRIFLLSTLCLSLLAFISCKSDEVEPVYNPATQGRVSFELVRHNVYLVADLTEARTIKLTLQMPSGDTLTLPSQQLQGTEDMISTQPLPLPVGQYVLLSYRCFDVQGDMIEDLDIQLTQENRFEVKAGEDLAFCLPIQVKRVLTTSNLYNSLRGICLEILGDDEERWPKSWDFESGEITIEWAGLEFDTDANSNPTDVIGLIIDGEPDSIINSDTWERRLVSLPEFHDMKVLPSCVTNLTSLQSIMVRNCLMERLPAELQYSNINNLVVENTLLASLPDELSRMSSLTSVGFKGNRFTAFPECLTQVGTMEIFTLEDEAISDIPASIAQWGEHLVSLTISGTDITSLPDVFDRLWRVSSLDFSRNPHLSTLPASIGLEQIPYDADGDKFTHSAINGLNLSDCAFTTIPAPVQRVGIRYLNLSRNAITSLTSSQFASMTDLETLVLDGNKLSSFPRLENPNLQMLSLIGTGLTRSQVDLSGLPRLNPRYVFFTQEEYDAVFSQH